MIRAQGIDISYYDISFDPTKSIYPIDFVIQRVSYGGSSGSILKDPAFSRLLPGVQKVSIRGAYHYFSTFSSWQKQADFFLKTIKDADYHFYALDFESAFNQFTSQTVQDCISWMKYVQENTGKKTIFYTNPNLYDMYAWAYCADWPLWIAQYWNVPSPNKNPGLGRHRKKGDWLIYQYDCEINQKPGQSKNYGCGATCIDRDVFNGTVEDMQSWIEIGIPLISPTVNKDGLVNATRGLNVRDQPSILSKKLFALPYKADVIVYDMKNNWYKISEFSEQWLSAKYITIKE